MTAEGRLQPWPGRHSNTSTEYRSPRALAPRPVDWPPSSRELPHQTHAQPVDYEKGPFAEWRAGFRHDPADRASWWRPWLDLIQETVSRGVVVRRARIVSEPVSEYTRFLYDGTFTNVAAGEQVRWLPRRRASDIALPGNDFWLIDNRLIRWNHFTGDGASGGGEISEDPAAAKLCADAFEAVWERGIPHETYTIS